MADREAIGGWLRSGVVRFMPRLAVVVLACLLVSCAAPSARDGDDPGVATAVLTEDGAWCWFGEPRAVYHEGAHRRTYAGWVTGTDGTIVVAAFDHDTGRLDTATVGTAHRNDHANPSLLVRPDGRLTVFFSLHNGEQMFHRTTTRPEDVTSWEPTRTVDRGIDGRHGITYPNPTILSAEDDRMYLFWRRGDTWQPTFSTSDDGGETWSAPRVLVEVDGKRPYLKMVSNGVDTIHFAFTDGHPREAAQNNVYHLAYRDGAFVRADGTRVGGLDDLPLSVDRADVVYDAAASGAGRGWIWDIALDDAGRPVVVHSALPTEDDHHYRYARWTGAGWENHPITPAGGSIDGPSEPHYSGGIALDHDDPASVYLSRQAAPGALHRLERWRTTDGGSSWTSSVVASDPQQADVRPVVVRGRAPDGPRVLWMRGEYTYYTDYDTGIRSDPPFRVAERAVIDVRDGADQPG